MFLLRFQIRDFKSEIFMKTPRIFSSRFLCGGQSRKVRASQILKFKQETSRWPLLQRSFSMAIREGTAFYEKGQ
ncbi:MAG: hypothetical protein AUG51_26545 [Acidobacteria bacterium 13_1_20CM_3_53_8]|nr:MAG: hypothetical protein AUG51_26545 [Acidobacteria bacterium 13_1_20CM_3_53_8]